MSVAIVGGDRTFGRKAKEVNLLPTAVITGITGQDGSYLAELLLGMGYTVYGMIRRASVFNTDRIDHIYHDPHEAGVPLHLEYGDMMDVNAVRRLIEEAAPDEVYNLAAQSHVKVSFDQPDYTAETIAMGALRLLDVVHDYCLRSGRGVRVYQAGSSEMFGSSPPPQDESTPFHPRSPYAASKVAAHWYAVNYREAYGMYVANGILFNHESPRRGETFVTRKITRAVGRIVEGLQDAVYLGHLDARRDWGFAGDYVRGMWMMLQQGDPSDFVLATGESHSVAEFADTAFGHVGLRWEDYVRIDDRYMRPAEVEHLRGNAARARAVLQWEPRVGFRELVEMMVEADVALAKQERMLVNAGYAPSQRGDALR